ncbi:uncharacterized protein GGS25DRAFT_530635 [Hypoxylon fragiforme]|uniref:uncharacterized protein n=1 Tax=Hypoxylon fragiforme TaxID=63214 RepID=UPI0020C6696E|nr:uncharacterized protein GGS25DRAFT_530635 [Hypoxylon fragiforme]KAI2609522.1 hypothetical protein GGS25DRAFT_530635 [Hypoxylon fragiforme]
MANNYNQVPGPFTGNVPFIFGQLPHQIPQGGQAPPGRGWYYWGGYAMNDGNTRYEPNSGDVKDQGADKGSLSIEPPTKTKGKGEEVKSPLTPEPTRPEKIATAPNDEATEEFFTVLRTKLRTLEGSELREVILSVCLNSRTTLYCVISYVKKEEAAKATTVPHSSDGLGIHLQYLSAMELEDLVIHVCEKAEMEKTRDTVRHLVEAMEDRKLGHRNFS